MSLVCTFLGLWTLATRFFTLFLYDHIAAVSTHGKQSVVLLHPGFTELIDTDTNAMCLWMTAAPPGS